MGPAEAERLPTALAVSVAGGIGGSHCWRSRSRSASRDGAEASLDLDSPKLSDKFGLLPFGVRFTSNGCRLPPPVGDPPGEASQDATPAPASALPVEMAGGGPLCMGGPLLLALAVEELVEPPLSIGALFCDWPVLF